MVERWIPGANKRSDAFGFGDILVLDSKPGALLIQCTVTGSMSSRVHKIREQCADEARAWLGAGNRIEVWGWALRVHRNKDGSKAKVKRWTLRVVEVTEV